MNQYPLVYLDHVHKNYGDAPALYDVSLNIQPGRIIGLLSPNGSGKTTRRQIGRASCRERV